MEFQKSRHGLALPRPVPCKVGWADFPAQNRRRSIKKNKPWACPDSIGELPHHHEHIYNTKNMFHICLHTLLNTSIHTHDCLWGSTPTYPNTERVSACSCQTITFDHVPHSPHICFHITITSTLHNWWSEPLQNDSVEN